MAGWRELPRLLAIGALWTASLIPVVVAITGGAPVWLCALSCFPVALLTTGVARSGAAASSGAALRVRDVFRVDPVLAGLLVTAGGLSAAALAAGGALLVAGAIATALVLLLAPLALAYGAVRDRTGLAAIRGGAVLALARPGWALTLLALGVLSAFAAAASLGVLLLAVPGLFATVVAAVTGRLLTDLGVPVDPVDNRLTPDRRHAPGRHPESPSPDTGQRSRAS